MDSRYRNLCPNCFNQGFSGRCTSCGYVGLSQGENMIVLQPGSVLNNRYVIGRTLGAGGFGITYLAIDTATNTKCAVKEYLPSGSAVRDPGTASISPSSNDSKKIFDHGLEVFLNEADVLRNFAGQSAIVQVRDCFKQNNTAYFTMEYLDGVNLKALARSSGKKLPVGITLEVIIKIAEALVIVHNKGLLHRDISPENIFITRSGETKLIDFGATRYFVGERSRSLSVILKPGFAPPEQYSSKGNQGPWTDIYALAATFYCIVSGTPMPDSLDRLSGKQIASLHEIVPGISRGVSDAIDKALTLNFRERYQTINEFLSAIHNERVVEVPRESKRMENIPFVQLTSGDSADKWIVPKNMDMVVGRSPESCNIVLSAPNISRAHCVIKYDEKDQCFYLRDLSTNGTFLSNGQRLDKSELYALQPGEIFYVLSTEFALKVGVE